MRIPFCGFICHSELSIHYVTLTHETALRGISNSQCQILLNVWVAVESLFDGTGDVAAVAAAAAAA